MVTGGRERERITKNNVLEVGSAVLFARRFERWMDAMLEICVILWTVLSGVASYSGC